MQARTARVARPRPWALRASQYPMDVNPRGQSTAWNPVEPTIRTAACGGGAKTYLMCVL